MIAENGKLNFDAGLFKFNVIDSKRAPAEEADRVQIILLEVN